MTLSQKTRKLVIPAMAAAILLAGAAAFMANVAPHLAPWTLDPTDPRVSLEDVEREVVRRYRVPEMTPATLAGRLPAGEVTLFDVRTAEEFETGHLPGAIRIEPGSTAEEILRLHRDRIAAGPVVFYCAVGVRSSDLMMRTLAQIAPHASAGLYNLRGGVFRWSTEGRALVSRAAPGRAHPFDENWGRLLARTTPAR
jgi:rhodanese-related sulfurtransferase